MPHNPSTMADLACELQARAGQHNNTLPSSMGYSDEGVGNVTMM